MTEDKLADFLIREIAIEKFPLTAITGSGGKTTLMLVIAGLLSRKGRVAVTTTTKIAVSEGSSCGGLFVGGTVEAVAMIAALPPCGALTIVRERRGDKLYGFTPQEVDIIAGSGAADWLIAESDGSFRLPLKAYEEWEPPIPALTSLQFAVIGADAFTRPFGKETAFRPGLLEKRFGLRRGEMLCPRTAARILSSRGEYLKNSPPHARRVLILNKADIPEPRKLAEILRGLSEVSGYELLAAVSLRTDSVYEIIRLSGKRAEP